MELLYAAAAVTALIPLSSLVGLLAPDLRPWTHRDWTLAFDAFALLGAIILVIAARRTRRRTFEGRRDSIWHRGSGSSVGDAFNSAARARS